MQPKFGTSGLRGLVKDLSPTLVRNYTRAFTKACDVGETVIIGWDLRPSSLGIAQDIAAEIKFQGLNIRVAGAVPTPALAYAASVSDASAIMVTGSHIPADRNGIKFYTRQGEISKGDEDDIVKNLENRGPLRGLDRPTLETDPSIAASYVDRYKQAFGPNALAGLRIGVYQHSSVARDLIIETLESLGAETTAIARSESFVPVDTEAVEPETRALLGNWCKEHQLDSLVSTDGDGDRPMVTDSAGTLIPGDTLGVLTALELGARAICTPVSSNSMVQEIGAFSETVLTKIGSPFVIEAMEQLLAGDGSTKVVGYEANGGFLLGFDARLRSGPIKALNTRDCMLPILSVLAAAARSKKPLDALVQELPARFTAADRIQGVETERSMNFIQDLTETPERRRGFFKVPSPEARLDLTDGLRVVFQNGEIVHLRPSGNAPEIRCYTEAGSEDRAKCLLMSHMDALRIQLSP